jgi:hypothetical protein
MIALLQDVLSRRTACWGEAHQSIMLKSFWRSMLKCFVLGDITSCFWGTDTCLELPATDGERVSGGVGAARGRSQSQSLEGARYVADIPYPCSRFP